MNSKVKLFLVGVCGIAVGISMTNYAISAAPGAYKVGTVDVQKVVSSSKQVQSLKTDQQKKMQDLADFVSKAKAALDKETDAAKKKTLEEKYNKELLTKRDSIEKEYTAKLSQIDKDITGIITQNASKNNYDLVLAKGVVLFGGNDITEDIIKVVK